MNLLFPFLVATMVSNKCLQLFFNFSKHKHDNKFSNYKFRVPINFSLLSLITF